MVKRYEFQSEYGYGEVVPDDSDGTFVTYDDYATLQAENAELEKSLQERWENLNVQDGVIDGLREEIAALKAELARAKESLIEAWAYAEKDWDTWMHDCQASAEARYKREIAQQSD